MTEKKPNKARKVIGGVLIALALLLTADVCLVMAGRVSSVVLMGTYRTVFLYELALCAALLLFSLDVRTGLLTAARRRVFRVCGWALRLALTGAVCVVCFFACRAMAGGLVSTAAPADHALVLGMALENGEPTADLLYRLDAAQGYLERNPGTVLVLTGGNADASGRTEARVMRDLLAARGVPAERMVTEDRAETTRDNFLNAALLFPPSEPVVLVTSAYHMDRACAEARRAGFTDVLRLPAACDPLRYPANLLWEVIMDIRG